MRSARVQVAGRVSYRAAIERYYRAHPEATQLDVRRATGAPKAVVARIFDQLVQRGQLERRTWKKHGHRDACDCSPE